MLFNKNEQRVNDIILYQTKTNMLLGCKKAILGIIILFVILTVSPMAIRFIGEMQVYLISQVKLPLTRYTAIAFFVVILINVIYIIWQLVGWYSMEYTLTESKIIIKSGVLSTKKNYMPYTTIQDINTSQNILARLINVGSVSVYSAYDNNQMELKNIYNPSEVEEIIFSKMVESRNFQAPPRNFPPHSAYSREYMDSPQNFSNPGYQRDFYEEDYFAGEEYYDEYEPITPITHERNVSRNNREYDYFPEDFPTQQSRHKYEYEPYDNGFGNSSSRPSRESYYDQVKDNYSYSEKDYYRNNEPNSHYDEGYYEPPQSEPEHVDNSSQKAIRRHFDKFKK